MFGHLYRYPHPLDATRFIYCGQGHDRDKKHRFGSSSFGRRFKRDFPNIELPQPVRETVEVYDQFELNELETIWMFRYHTWRGYEGGMNITIPGAADYKNMIALRSRESLSAAGKLGGRKAVESGQLRDAARKAGEWSVKSGHQRKISFLGGRAAAASGHTAAMGRKHGVVQGLRNVASGHLTRINELPQTKVAKLATGRANFENKIGIFARTAEQRLEDCRKGGRTIMCFRYNVRRDKPCVCGSHAAVAV
jgi:hypothetical protein